MHSAYRRTLILFLCLGLALEQSYSKTVTSKTGPCHGENCPPEDSLNPGAQGEGGQNPVENMAHAPGGNTGEYAEKTTEENEELHEEKPNGNSDGVEKDGAELEEDMPGGRPEDANPEQADSSPPPPEEEHGTGLNQENGEHNKEGDKSTGNTEERPEEKNEEPKQESQGHRIVDPEVNPHPDDGGGGHVVQDTEAAQSEISRIEPEPNAEKELDGGAVDVHSGGPSHHEEDEGTDSGRGESGPDLDAVLHGGDRHVHAHAAAPGLANSNSETEARGEFGVDPERIMHSEGGANVHARRGPAHRGLVNTDPAHDDSAHRDEGQTGSDGDHRDYATDIDSVLHGGKRHVHTPDAGIQNDDPPEVPIGATDLEALVHGGDGHVHSQPRSSSSSSSSRNDPEPRPYGVQDPESVLHGSDDHEHRIQREAVDGSRPLPSQTDPDSSPTDAVDPEDVRIGTLRPEDGDDYHQWKAEKRQQEEEEKEEEGRSSWFSGFTYLKGGLWRDLRAAKDRYLAKFWSGKGGGTDDGKPVRTPHDEP